MAFPIRLPRSVDERVRMNTVQITLRKVIRWLLTPPGNSHLLVGGVARCQSSGRIKVRRILLGKRRTNNAKYRVRIFRSESVHFPLLFHFCRVFIRKLAGITLFITGASRGIGKAIALKAARDGANIVLAAKTAEPHPKLPGTIYTAAAESKIAMTPFPRLRSLIVCCVYSWSSRRKSLALRRGGNERPS